MGSFAYIHCKPDGTPFYVGKGALRRARYFGERNPHHRSVVAKYGVKNLLYGVLECSDDATAYELERGLIKCLQRAGVRLSNLTEGGDGGRNPTAETRARMSAAAKKRGVSVACQLAKAAAKRGKPLSAEHKDKLRQIASGRKFTEEHRRNISESAKKRGMSPQIRQAACLAISRKVWVGEVLYNSIVAAARFIGCTPPAVRNALRNTGVVKGYIVRYGDDD